MPRQADDDVQETGSRTRSQKTQTQPSQNHQTGREPRVANIIGTAKIKAKVGDWASSDDEREAQDNRDNKSDKREAAKSECSGKKGKAAQQLAAKSTKQHQQAEQQEDHPEKKPRKRRKRKSLSYDEYYKKIDLKQVAIEKLQARLKKQEEKYAELQQTYKDLVEDNDQLKMKLEQSLQEQEQKDDAVAQMQNELTELLGSDIPATPDDNMQDKLAKLFSQSKSWAEKWAAKNWALVNADAARSIGGRLQSAEFQSCASAKVEEAILKGNIPPRIVLNAIVNRILSHNTLSHPFSFLGHTAHGEDLASTEGRLVMIKNLLNKRLPTFGHRFRALVMFGQLIRQEMHDSEYVSDLETYTMQVYKTIMKGAQDLLLDVDASSQEVREKRLREIVTSFVTATAEVHGQYPAIEFLFRSGLKHLLFAEKHEYFGCHRGVGLRTGPDDKDLPDARSMGIEGEPLDLIVEPAVTRRGDADGQSYDTRKVLRPAIVWMMKADDVEGHSKVGYNLKLAPYQTSYTSNRNMTAVKSNEGIKSPENGHSAEVPHKDLAFNTGQQPRKPSTAADTEQSPAEEAPSSKIKQEPGSNLESPQAEPRGTKRTSSEYQPPAKKARTSETPDSQSQNASEQAKGSKIENSAGRIIDNDIAARTKGVSEEGLNEPGLDKSPEVDEHDSKAEMGKTKQGSKMVEVEIGTA